MSSMISKVKSNVLLVGSGGVGTMAAYALETGGKAEVTAILRSNFEAVQKSGFSIDSLNHGSGIVGWKPTTIRNTIPNVAKESLKPFDFIVVTTKNVPDISPTVVDIIEPAVTPGHTTIALVQNGLNIERPLIEKFPTNVILSGVSLIGATEISKGVITQEDKDVLILGPFDNPGVSKEISEEKGREFADIYNACGKVECRYDTDVPFSRWKKLIYNGTFNPVATILGLDTTRMRISEHIIDNLIRPTMLEIKAIALAAGITLPDDIVENTIVIDPIEAYFKPSMCQDIEKGNYIEFENIVGEPLRTAEKLGVETPMLKIIYGILKGLQWKTMEAKGLVIPKFHEGSLYS